VNYEDTPEVVFDPEMGDVTKITLSTNSSKNIFTNVQKLFVNAAANTDETYGDSYFQVMANNVADTNEWGDIYISSLHAAADYAEYTTIKAWVYVVSNKEVALQASIFGQAAQTVTPNQWVQISIPMATYTANSTKAFFGANFRNNASWGGVIGVRIGKIEAVKEVKNDVFLFNPASTTAASQVSTRGKAFGYGDKATYNFVASSADATYNGAYVQIGSTALTTSNQWGNVLLTPEGALDSYATYTTIKAWIYLEAYGTGEETISFANGQVSKTLVKNTWTQVEIPMATYLANSSPFCGRNFSANTSWGVTGIRIGEITAVK